MTFGGRRDVKEDDHTIIYIYIYIYICWFMLIYVSFSVGGGRWGPWGTRFRKSTKSYS